jgi:sugar phosphate permease
MTIAMTGVAAATAAMGLLPPIASIGLLIVLRFAFGGFSAPVFPSAAALTTAWFQRGAYGRVQGSIAGASGLGGTIAPVAVAAIVATQGWRASYLYTAAATLLFAALWHARIRNGVSDQDRPAAASPFGYLLRNRTLRLLTLSYAAASFLSALFDNWIFYYFREVRHYPLAASAWFTTATQISVLICLPMGGWFADRLPTLRGRQLFCVGIQTFSGASLVLASTTHNQVTAILVFCVTYGVFSVTDAFYSATVLETGGDAPASAYGVMNSGYAFGVFLGSIALPAIAGAAGWNAALYATSGVIIAGGLLWLLIRSP